MTLASAPHYPPATWRLLRSAVADGATNMAVDEAILLSVATREAMPTLRFFGWTPPCLSLGYAQTAADVDASQLDRLGYHLVRRPTGGRAILHTDELTYSVIAPLNEPRVQGGVVQSYQQLSAGLMCGLAHLGLTVNADRIYDPSDGGPLKGPVCFEVPSNYEITVGTASQPRKLLGSAQVRKQGVVLQHGTLPLTGDLGRICDVLAFANEAERRRARARLRERATTVEEVTGRPVTYESAADAVARGFGEALNLALVEAPLSARELAVADRLRTDKYSTEEWNRRI